MLFAAEFGTGQVLWSILWFFLFFVWIMLIFTIFGDIIRSDDMGGWAKALWSIFIIFVPFLGIFLYLIVRGGSMGERQMKAAKAQEAAERAKAKPDTGNKPKGKAPRQTRVASLYRALRSERPIEGQVGQVIKGGYEVRLGKVVKAVQVVMVGSSGGTRGD